MFSFLLGATFLLAPHGCIGNDSCTCNVQLDSCVCHLTEADTTLTVEVKEKYVKFPLGSDRITLHYVINNRTVSYYEIPDYVAVEHFENGKWMPLRSKTGDKEMLVLKEGGLVKNVKPYEENKVDSFFLMPNRFFFEPGKYRAKITFEHKRVYTESDDLFSFLGRSGKKVVCTSEFMIADTIPEEDHESMQQPDCHCPKRQQAIENWRTGKDSVITVRNEQPELKLPITSKMVYNLYIENHTANIYLHRPFQDFCIERLVGMKEIKRVREENLLMWERISKAQESMLSNVPRYDFSKLYKFSLPVYEEILKKAMSQDFESIEKIRESLRTTQEYADMYASLSKRIQEMAQNDDRQEMKISSTKPHGI